LPTLITLGNGTCGLVSIAVLTTARPQLGDTKAAFYSGMLIFLGMVFDAVDGYVARVSHQESDFGVQLDSLCDAITFGVAPVFIMLNLAAGFYLRFLWSIGVVFSMCAVLRLARYNVESHEHGYFRGLPSPAAAGTVASFAIAMPALIEWTGPAMPALVQLLGQWCIESIEIGMPVLTLILAGLMVSRIRYPHVVNQFLRRRRGFYTLTQFVFVAAVVVVIHELALPLLFSLFAFGYPIVALWNRLTSRGVPAATSSEEPVPNDEQV
jgi:CDP-diacylglycerol--serine O-phosphatidyltransferase